MQLLFWLKLLRNLFASLFLVIVTLSTSTLFWPVTSGEILSNQIAILSASSYPTARGQSFSGSVNEQQITYRYQYQGNSYLGERICFCLPYAVYEHKKLGSIVDVRVMPYFPSVSVLRGIVDIGLLAIIAAVSFSFSYLHKVIVRIVNVRT